MSDKKEGKKWVPLEGNPDLLNKYIYQLGVDKSVQFYEVYGVDEELLGLIPQPVYAVLMCFPISEASEQHKDEEAAKIEKEGQVVSKNVYHTLQTVSNACGTVGLIHSIYNNLDKLSLDQDKFFAKFLAQTKDMSPADRAKALEEDDEVEESHQSVAAEGVSDVEHKVNNNVHFNAFVVVDGHLYELDGRKKFPINHGPSSLETLLPDAIGVIKQFMARDPKDIRFTMCALAAAE